MQHKKTLILAAIVAVIIGGSFYSYWAKTSVPDTASYNGPGVQPAAAAQAKAGEPAVIYISGAVNRPGVYRVSPQIRVVDAINQAGGLAAGADIAKVNLAQPVKDGMHIYIPLTGDKSSQGHASTLAAEKVNINIADKAALEKLPGIGPSLADRIIEYRKSNGGFKETAELKKVSGIGDTKYNQLKDRIEL